MSCVEAPDERPDSTPAGTGLSFASASLLIEHWQKHGRSLAEFNPVLTKEQYLEKARAFFTSTAPDIETKSRDNGDRLRFRRSTNEFGVLSDTNNIRTYFRPNNGASYWERQ